MSGMVLYKEAINTIRCRKKEPLRNQIPTRTQHSKLQDAKLRSSGVVVVVFRYQNDMRACLKKCPSMNTRFSVPNLSKPSFFVPFSLARRPNVDAFGRFLTCMYMLVYVH